jgi:hypothetical protein
MTVRRSVRSSRAVNDFMNRWGHMMKPSADARIADEYAPQLHGWPLPVSPGTVSSSGRCAAICSNIAPTPPYSVIGM